MCTKFIMSIELRPRLANPEKVGLEGGEERDFEDLLAHLADRIKVRFGRVCYREFESNED